MGGQAVQGRFPFSCYAKQALRSIYYAPTALQLYVSWLQSYLRSGFHSPPTSPASEVRWA